MNKFKFISFLMYINLSQAGMFDFEYSNIGTVNLEASASIGTIYFHTYVPTTSTTTFADSLSLNNERYTDLIMSNYIAGVLLGYNISKTFPGITFNKDYVYGTLMGQLLQENLETQDYFNTSNLIDPSPSQVDLMGKGQGGPYQINLYYADFVSGSYSPSGYSLTNYVAIQKNIGYTMLQQANQINELTPPIFNNKYFGPIITSYFQLNDLRALYKLGSGTSPAPNFVNCINRSQSIPNNPLDIIINYAYNQGFYGGLLDTITTDCVKMSPSKYLAKYNSFANAGPNSGTNINTYKQYPYQVRFYLNELYNSSTLTNNVAIYFSIQQLRNVFVNVFNYVAYIDQQNNYVTIPTSISGTAFDNALQSLGISNTVSLNLSDSNQRTSIYSLLETAIKNLEIALPTDFSKTTLTQIGVPVPPCPAKPVVYPANVGKYVNGSIVQGSDMNFYSCIQPGWCNSSVPSPYAPITGFAWSQAWSQYQCK